MKNKQFVKKRKQHIALLMGLLLTASLCACRDKKPVDILDDETSPIQENGESLKEKMGVPDEVEYHLEWEENGRTQEQTITPKVSISDASFAGFYELEAIDFTTDYMEEVCDMLFDKGEYSIIWPDYIYAKEELQEQYDMLDEEVSAWTDEDEQSYFMFYDWLDLGNRLENYQDDWKTYEVLEPGDDLVIYPSPMKRTSTDELVEKDFDPYFNTPANVKAEGTIDGRTARISFMHYNVDGRYHHISLDFDRNMYTYYQCYGKSDAEGLPTTFVQTEEEAVRMAESYVEMVGLSEMELIHTSYIMEYDESYSGGFGEMGSLSIYRFTFGLCKNDVSMLYDGEYQGLVSVDIGPEGLAGMYIRSPYRIVSNLTEDSELLTFEQISAIAEAHMAENPGWYHMIDRIEFGYAVVNYESESVLVPVWAYVCDYGTVFERTDFLINAVDGSIIRPVLENDINTNYWLS